MSLPIGKSHIGAVGEQVAHLAANVVEAAQEGNIVGEAPDAGVYKAGRRHYGHIRPPVDATAIGGVDWRKLDGKPVLRVFVHCLGVRQVHKPERGVVLHNLHDVVGLHPDAGLQLACGDERRHEAQPRGAVELPLESQREPLRVLGQLHAVLFPLHGLGEPGADETRGDCHNGNSEQSDDGHDDAADRRDGRSVDDIVGGVAKVARERPQNGHPPVVVDLRLRRMLKEEEHERQHEGDDDQKLKRDEHLARLGAHGVAQQPRRPHETEYAEQPEDAERAENGIGQRDEERDVERVGRDEIDKAVERHAISHAPPDPLELGRQLVGHPNAQRDLDGEEYDRHPVHNMEESLPPLRQIERREENAKRAYDDKRDYRIVDNVAPLHSPRVVVEDTRQLPL